MFILAAVLGMPSAAHAQGVDDVLDALKDQALGFARGCDYASYLNAAQQIANGWDFIANLQNWRPSRGHDVIPVVSFLSEAFEAGTRTAARRSAEAQAEGLIYQLEQVCQTAMQVDETNRIHRIFQAGHLNIGNAIDYLFRSDSAIIRITPGTEEGSLNQDFAATYESLTPDPRFENDTIYHAITSTLYASLEASDNMLKSLEDIQEDINQLKDDLKLRATPDTSGNFTWICPEGYPGEGGFNTRFDLDPALESIDGVPICGPVPPARAQQILAATEVLKVQMMAIAQAAEARHLQVSAVSLMADNQLRRQRNFLSKKGEAF